MPDQAPASQKLAAVLRAEIASGALLPGAKVPAIRKLAELHGVAIGTAQAAVDLLRADGLVYASPGRGTFVREDVAGAEVIGAGDVQQQIAHLASTVSQLADRVAELESHCATSGGPS
jgi:DNA-binding GntR family transcriptional regulator